MDIVYNSIPVKPLLKEFNCSVCLTLIDDCFSTKCGHTFCKPCISETVNRHHKCPVCQSTLNESEYYRNIAMNNLRNIIAEEENKSKTIYTQNLVSKLDLEKDSQLEEIFVNSMNSHILIFRNKLNETKRDFESSRAQLIAKEGNSNLDEKLQALDQEFQEVTKYLRETLKEHLDKVVPNSDMLDLVCNIYLPQKEILLNNINIQPYKTINGLKGLIIAELNKAGHNVSYINDNMGYIIIVPPEKKILYNSLINEKVNLQSFKNFDEYLTKIKNFGLEHVKIDSKEVIGNFKVHPYSVLIYVGDYKFKELPPPECITYNYEKGAVVNYFSCEDCKTNWICEPCSNYCHKGHNLVTHLSNKKTSWACCYCVRDHLCNFEQRCKKVIIPSPAKFCDIVGSYESSE